MNVCPSSRSSFSYSHTQKSISLAERISTDHHYAALIESSSLATTAPFPSALLFLSSSHIRLPLLSLLYIAPQLQLIRRPTPPSSCSHESISSCYPLILTARLWSSHTPLTRLVNPRPRSHLLTLSESSYQSQRTSS